MRRLPLSLAARVRRGPNREVIVEPRNFIADLVAKFRGRLFILGDIDAVPGLTDAERAEFLMLLNRARLPARFDDQGRIVTLDRQDRGLWNTHEIAEGVRVLHSALAEQRPGRYQIEAAIAALLDDAASAEETDWRQILAWYDDLVALTDDPVGQSRSV